MAITVSALHRQVPGAAIEIVAEVTLDSSYPSGGYAFTPATFGLSSLQYAIPIVGNAGYVVVHDQANLKFKVFQQNATSGPLVEVAGATNLSTVKIYVLVKGR